MMYYSGYSLSNEKDFFSSYIVDNELTVSGFSYGAIKAFEYVHDAHQRIDILQLFSPAFFQTQKKSFKKLQLKMYEKNSQAYLQQFLSNCFLPYQEKSVETYDGGVDALKELLYYEWNIQKLQKVVEKGIKIEVYIGSNDHIVDAQAIKEFFLPFSTVHEIKDANHFLLTN